MSSLDRDIFPLCIDQCMNGLYRLWRILAIAFRLDGIGERLGHRGAADDHREFRTLLTNVGAKPKGKVMLATVQGDVHDIGKNLVSMMWKGANFGVVDVGTNVPAQKFVEAIREHNAKVVGLSALLTTTMDQMRTITEAIRSAGLDDTKVIIGGAPITQKFADKIGADGYAPDAASAVDQVRELMAV